MKRKSFVYRVILYLGMVLLALLELVIRGQGYSLSILPQAVILTAFVGIEVVNLMLLHRNGMYGCFTCPIFCIEVIHYYGMSDWLTKEIIGFAALVFILKGVELGIALQKRHTGKLRQDDYFSRYTELAIVASVLFDVARLI